MVVDFHSHILPAIDDGSKNMYMTKEMICAGVAQGVNRIAFTPHFYANQDNPSQFLKRRQEALDSVISALIKDFETFGLSDLEFKQGAEIYFFSGIANSRHLADLCLEKTNIILLEMPFRQWTKDVYRDVKDIIEKQQLTVMLAHIERFRKYQKDISIWNEILQLPVIPQMNAECFLSWRLRRFAFKFIMEGHSIILGTDAHNVTDRPVNMSLGREVLRKKFGEELLKDIDIRSDKLWRNDEP
ncbi:CpsB/CapC family capsule biosynthesis tyrosine phosphatase [Butyrivibrio sp. JL13D10]|uniref:CpsB/CapC family capsule biosynthesis tyrosine phosphatase n=1 Tax=Butyrivibrio sp. JL13D10 TaxID=3236815 RepID=UPI0038B47F9D